MISAFYTKPIYLKALHHPLPRQSSDFRRLKQLHSVQKLHFSHISRTRCTRTSATRPSRQCFFYHFFLIKKSKMIKKIRKKFRFSFFFINFLIFFIIFRKNHKSFPNERVFQENLIFFIKKEGYFLSFFRG